MDNQNSSTNPAQVGFLPSFMGPLPGTSQAPSTTSTPTRGDPVSASQSLPRIESSSFVDELIGLDGWSELLKPRPNSPAVPPQAGRPSFPCDICGSSFISYRTLEDHKSTHGPYYVCLICPDDSSNGKPRFSNQILLNEHLRKAHRRRVLKWDALNHVELRYEGQDQFRSATTSMATPSRVFVPTGSSASSRTDIQSGTPITTGTTQPISPSLERGPSRNRKNSTQAPNPKVEAVATWRELPLQLWQPGQSHNLGRANQEQEIKTKLATGINSNQVDLKVLANKINSLSSKVKKLSQSPGLHSIASTDHKLPKKAAKNKRMCGELDNPAEKGMDGAARDEKMDGQGQSKKKRLVERLGTGQDGN